VGRTAATPGTRFPAVLIRSKLVESFQTSASLTPPLGPTLRQETGLPGHDHWSLVEASWSMGRTRALTLLIAT
jgi:hypothetical protein